MLIFLESFSKGLVTIPTIVELGHKVRSNLVQFFVLIPNLASDLPYVAYFGGKSTSKLEIISGIKKVFIPSGIKHV